MLVLVLLGALLGIVKGEPVEWTVMPTNGVYVSPPIGLGPNGGSLSANISLVGKLKFESVLSVLTGEQLAQWRKWLVPEQDSDFTPVEPNAYVSTYLTTFTKSVNVSLTLPSEEPRQYFFVLTLPWNDSIDRAGSISVDWSQHDGSGVQFQYFGLKTALEVIFSLVTLCAVTFGVFLVIHRKQVTRLHGFHLTVLVYASAFIVKWLHAVEMENATGDRTSWESKWIPSLMEKGFDILEVLVYVLTSIGWMTVRQSLVEGELRMMVTGSLLSFLLGMAEIECGDDPIECGSFTSARMIIHMFGYLTAIVAFNYHLASLTAFLGEASVASVDTGKMYFRFNQFWWLRFVFLLR